MKFFNLNTGSAIALVWGLGFAIILLGLLLLGMDPRWVGWKEYEGPMLFGSWFMVIGFSVAIALSLVGLLTMDKKKKAAITGTRSLRADPEEVASWLDRAATWNNAAIFFLGGLVAFIFLPFLFPPYSAIIETVTAAPVLFGGLLGMWRIGHPKT